MFDLEQYHILNHSSNELICSDWNKIPKYNQIQMIMNEFGWNDTDDIEVIGNQMRFRVAANSKVFYQGRHFWTGIIEDRTYYVKFNNTGIGYIRMIEC